MTTLSADTLRVLNYCYRWGVGVVFGTPPHDVPANRRGLFTIFEGVIFRDPERVRRHEMVIGEDSEEPLDLLHELSHVLDGSPLSSAQELSGPMLALDYYGSRWLRLLGRSAWMRDFGIDDAVFPMSSAYEWGGLCVADKHYYLQQ
jgi:hypothetical protein